MPDSLLPIQGPASQRERDLDALLSGEPGYPVVVSGPVAGALAALRAAPAPDELDGEAAARAAFRLFVLPEAGEVGGAPVPAPLFEVPSPLYEVPSPLYEVPAQLFEVPAPLHQGAATGHAHSNGLSPTVVLRRRAPNRARHARPRRVPWQGNWQVMAAACGTAAAVIIGLVALAGGFSGPAGQQGQPGHPPSAQVTGTSGKRATSGVLGTATASPMPRPTPVSPQALCRQYTSYIPHLDQPANRAAENAVIQQLSKLAGGPTRINGYCAEQSGGAGSGADRDHWGGAGTDRGGFGWFGRGGH